MKKHAKLLLFNSLGWLFVALAIAGIILPLVPATPFLLLAGYFFSKGSPHFHEWLLNHRHFGPPVRDWRDYGAIRFSHKLLATSMMGVSATFIFLQNNIPLFGKLGFSTIALIGLSFLWTRPNP